MAIRKWLSGELRKNIVFTHETDVSLSLRHCETITLVPMTICRLESSFAGLGSEG